MGLITAAHADAERHLLSGLYYDHGRIRRRGFNCGAASALDWAPAWEAVL
jgi:hypothetical protein